MLKEYEVLNEGLESGPEWVVRPRHPEGISNLLEVLREWYTDTGVS